MSGVPTKNTTVKKKKRKTSKHVLKAREEKLSSSDQATASQGVVDAPNSGSQETAKKRKQPKNRHVVDPSRASSYLKEWQAKSSTWKFNKNMQSWLIRHMYEADKIPKAEFTILLEYLLGLESKAAKTRIRSDASRRALRFKAFEKSGAALNSTELKPEESTEKEAKDNEKDSKDVDGITEEARWQKLSDHDKRKEYKRARKILDTVKE